MKIEFCGGEGFFHAICGPGGDRLSRVLRRSIMGAGAFHGRVRNGIGWGVPAGTTRSANGILASREAGLCRGRSRRSAIEPIVSAGADRGERSDALSRYGCPCDGLLPQPRSDGALPCAVADRGVAGPEDSATGKEPFWRDALDLERRRMRRVSIWLHLAAPCLPSFAGRGCVRALFWSADSPGPNGPAALAGRSQAGGCPRRRLRPREKRQCSPGPLGR